MLGLGCFDVISLLCVVGVYCQAIRSPPSSVRWCPVLSVLSDICMWLKFFVMYDLISCLCVSTSLMHSWTMDGYSCGVCGVIECFLLCPSIVQFVIAEVCAEFSFCIIF